jgi:2-oxoglutarate dehydrogenase E1 component
VRRAGRPAVATPAVGVKAWHEAEVQAYLAAALGQRGASFHEQQAAS